MFGPYINTDSVHFERK